MKYFVIILLFVVPVSALAARLQPNENGVYEQKPLFTPPPDTAPNYSQNIERIPTDEEKQATVQAVQNASEDVSSGEQEQANKNDQEKKRSFFPFIVVAVVFMVLVAGALLLSSRVKQ